MEFAAAFSWLVLFEVLAVEALLLSYLIWRSVRALRIGRKKATPRWTHRVPLVAAVFGLIVVVAVDVLSFLRAPRRYRIDDSGLTVETRSGDRRFAFAWFEAAGRDVNGDWARVVHPFQFQLQGRRVSGPFGVSGTTRAVGREWVNVYVTDPRRVVALTGRVNLLISPRDPDRFLAALEGRLRAKHFDLQPDAGDEVGEGP